MLDGDPPNKMVVILAFSLIQPGKVTRKKEEE